MTQPVLGRDGELALLHETLAQTVSSGESCVVLVRGEPGIGKSTLLRAFAAAATGSGSMVGYGQAMTSSLSSDSFQAVRECLRALVASAESSGSRVSLDRVAHAFRANAPAWLESVPVVGNLLAVGMQTGLTLAASGRSVEHLTSALDQLTGLVTELTETAPVVLILDDLHWADSSTIDLLLALALKVSGPFMLVLAYRSDDLRRSPDGEPHPLQRAVFRLRRYRPQMLELSLMPLSDADTRALILSTDPTAGADPSRVRELVARSGGIPLYAESLAMARGRALRAADHAGGDSREIDAVLEERLSFVSSEDLQLLEAAVVIGYTFEVDYLAALARADIDEVYDRLDSLMRDQHLIVPATGVGLQDRYSLAHPLLGEMLARRSASNPPRWRRAHQRLVTILLGEDGSTLSDEMICRAASAALTASDPRAADLAVRAAKRTYAAGNVTDAVRFARSAIDLADAATSFEAAVLLATCLSARGNHHEAVQVATRALADASFESVSSDERAELGLLRARNLRMTNQWGPLTETLDEIEGSTQVGPLVDQMTMLRAELALCGPNQDTNRCIELCQQIAHDSQDPALISRAFGHRGLAHLAAYDPADAEQWLQQAVTAASDHHPYTEYEAIHWHSKKKMACLELVDAWALLERLADMSDASGVASESPFHFRDSSRVLGLRGNTEIAAITFGRYVDAASAAALQQVLTMLACQTAELEAVHGRPQADAFLENLIANPDVAVLDARRRPVLTEAASSLKRRAGTWEPVEFAVQNLNVAPEHAHGADAVFRFDVADLRQLREVAAPGAG